MLLSSLKYHKTFKCGPIERSRNRSIKSVFSMVDNGHAASTNSWIFRWWSGLAPKTFTQLRAKHTGPLTLATRTQWHANRPEANHSWLSGCTNAVLSYFSFATSPLSQYFVAPLLGRPIYLLSNWHSTIVTFMWRLTNGIRTVITQSIFSIFYLPGIW